jgi:hypothetical protein
MKKRAARDSKQTNGAGERPKAPTPERTRPIRSFEGVFKARRDRESARANGAGPEGVMARSVEAGYKIIEEYVRQGQELARAFMPDRKDGAAPSRALTDRLVRSASDFAGLLSEFLQGIATDRASPPSGAQDPGDFGIEQTADAPSLSLAVTGNSRADVRVDLHPEGWQTALVVHELRGADGKAPPLRQVQLKTIAEERRVSVRIDIPARQPAGVYSGPIVSGADGTERGRIVVTVPPRRSDGSEG